MLKLKQMRDIFIWFSIFGQTQLVSIYSANSCLTRVLSGFKVIFMILLMTPIIKPFKETSRDASTSFDLITSFACFILLVDIIEITESWWQTKTFLFMIKDIDESFSHLDSFMDVKVCISNFAQRFRIKLLSCAILFSFELVINCFFEIPALNRYANIVIAFAAIYRNIAIIHIAFFIELMKMILSSINVQLNPSSSDSVNDCLIIPIAMNEAMLNLRRTKLIYSNVWNISEHINKRFGCFLLAVFLNAPLIFVRASIIIYMQSSSMIFNLHAILRKLILIS